MSHVPPFDGPRNPETQLSGARRALIAVLMVIALLVMTYARVVTLILVFVIVALLAC